MSSTSIRMTPFEKDSSLDELERQLPLLFVDLQDLVSATAAICDVFEAVKLLLLSAGTNDQPVQQKPLLELNIFNRASLNLMFAQTKHSLRHKHEALVVNLKITD